MTRDVRAVLRTAARRLPLTGAVLRHVDALTADRDALLRQRSEQSDQLDERARRIGLLESELQLARSDATTWAMNHGSLQVLHDSLVHAHSSAAADRDRYLAERDALARTAHTLLEQVNVVRHGLAYRHLRGDGIEIGALHRPLRLPEGTTVRYVDRMHADDLRAEYPELAEVSLVTTHIVDDGETLATVPPASVDFVIANHFLEHCADPIGTILTHLARLRPGGHLFYAVPHHDRTFDARRPLTSLAHLVGDHADRGASSRAAHYLEWAALVEDADDPAAKAADLDAAGYSIHHHTWTEHELFELCTHVARRAAATGATDGVVEIVASASVDDEVVLVLRKPESTSHRDLPPDGSPR